MPAFCAAALVTGAQKQATSRDAQVVFLSRM